MPRASLRADGCPYTRNICTAKYAQISVRIRGEREDSCCTSLRNFQRRHEGLRPPAFSAVLSSVTRTPEGRREGRVFETVCVQPWDVQNPNLIVQQTPYGDVSFENRISSTSSGHVQKPAALVFLRVLPQWRALAEGGGKPPVTPLLSVLLSALLLLLPPPPPPPLVSLSRFLFSVCLACLHPYQSASHAKRRKTPMASPPSCPSFPSPLSLCKL